MRRKFVATILTQMHYIEGSFFKQEIHNPYKKDTILNFTLTLSLYKNIEHTIVFKKTSSFCPE